ncbi:MAG: tRNA-specific 2-thiouridylase MnmA [Chloroflexi bacterium]|nr:tRNA-specific 2-thiouridylase MnmA [Chloroflexota bacterium]
MSGGVDSSVTAALLKERGYNVIGVMLRLWSESGREMENRCCTVDALNDARSIAGALDIPFYAIDAKEVFRDVVVEYFIDGYTQGLTPNPCLVCNRHIRWEFMFERAHALGGDYMATGHYARLRRGEDGKVQLLKGVDPGKDQSYVLHVLGQDVLQHTMLPLGEYTKEEVRGMAQEFNLSVADRPDSQDLCFVGEGEYGDFLRRVAPQAESPGPILSPAGERLGEHPGLAFFTIGQRRGLGISAPHPLYVLRKDLARNALIVGHRDELEKDHLTARDVNWIAGAPPQQPFRAEVKIRYTARPVTGMVTPTEQGEARVQFDEPLSDITPGQAAVFYTGEVCLGGGIIKQ